MASDRIPVACNIAKVGKNSEGRPQYWCVVHEASATGKYGARLSECEAAYLDRPASNVLEIRRNSYPGGIALWGAIKPVFNSTGLPSEEGIHVHARKDSCDAKIIDDTFHEVRLISQTTLFEERRIRILAKTAISYFQSVSAGLEVKHLFCTHCGEPHLDAGRFAVKPHRKHLCHVCGCKFMDHERSVSNPVDYIRNLFGDDDSKRQLVNADRHLRIRQSDFPGGLQIWASNPALIWTAPRPEEKGIHVHAFKEREKGRVIDDTFSSVVIDGINLDEDMLRHYMAQSSLDYLVNKIVALNCPYCGSLFFDRDMDAFRPRKTRVCEQCGGEFDPPGRRKLVVSNPFLETLGSLTSSNRSA